MKKCTKCGIEKPLSDFWRKGKRFNSACKACSDLINRKWRAANREKVRAEFRKGYLKRRYGLTPSGHAAIRQRQGNKCACCGEEFKTGRNQIAVDHCHKTGVVRGMLCSKCNLGIGHFNDSPERLLRAVGYLKKFEYLSVLF